MGCRVEAVYFLLRFPCTRGNEPAVLPIEIESWTCNADGVRDNRQEVINPITAWLGFLVSMNLSSGTIDDGGEG